MLLFGVLPKSHNTVCAGTRWRAPLGLLCVAATLLGGCGKKEGAPAPRLRPTVSRQYRQGSLQAVLSVGKTNITTAGRVWVSLEILAPSGSDVAISKIAGSTGALSVEERQADPPRPQNDGRVLRRTTWILVPNHPGNTTLQSLEVAAGAERILTDPIPIHISSLLPEGIKNPEIRDIAPPLPQLPEQAERRRRRQVVGELLAAILVAGLLAVLLRRMRRQQPLPTPYEKAVQSLEKLPDEPLQRVNQTGEILMAFLAEQFGLPVAGKTASEIAALSPPEIPAEEWAELGRLLREADSVRFSHRVPEGFAAAYEEQVRELVETTREDEPCD